MLNYLEVLFFKAVMQSMARKNCPLDKVCLTVDVTKKKIMATQYRKELLSVDFSWKVRNKLQLPYFSNLVPGL